MTDRNKIRSLLVAEVNDVEARVTVWSRRGSGWTPVVAQTVDLSSGAGQASLSGEDRNLRILEALKPLKLKAQYNILLLPKQAVTTRLVTLPTVEDDELQKMARYEAERQIPFNAERYVVSHHVVARQGIEGSKVLIAAIDSEVLEELIAPFQALGIKFQEAVDTTQALFQLLPPATAQTPVAEEEKTSGQVSMIVHVARRWIELVIIVGGQLRFSRSLSFGWENLARQLQENGGRAGLLQLQDFINLDALNPETFFNETSPPKEFSEESVPHHAIDEQNAEQPAPLAAKDDDNGENADADDAAANLRIELSAEPEVGGIKLENGSSLTVHSGEKDHAGDAVAQEPAPLQASASQAVAPEAVALKITEEEQPEFEQKKHPERPSEIVRAWLNRLLGQIRRTWEFAQREEEHPPLERLLLSGAAASWRNMNRFLQVNLGCPCHRLDETWTTRNLRVDKKLALAPETWNTHAGGLLQGAGLRPMTINLLTAGYLKQQVMRQRYRQWAITGVLALLLLGAGWMYYGKWQSNLAEEYQAYVRINGEYETRASSLLGALERVKILEAQVNEKRSALEILDLFNSEQIKSIPEKVTLQKIDYQRNVELTLTGFAKSIPDTDIFIKELRDTGLFENVEKLQSTLTSPFRGAPANIYKIVIKCYFPEVENNQP